MPAKLNVVAGPESGTELWVEYEVLRFGGDTGCELCLAKSGLEPHAFTMRFADGRYHVYNRGTLQIKLDVKALDPNDSGIWIPGKPLRFAGGTVLVLETLGDGAPCKKPSLSAATTSSVVDPIVPQTVSTAAVAGPAVTVTPPPPAGEKKKNNNAALVAAGFFLVVVLIILGGGSSDEADPATRSASFADVVAELQADPAVAPGLWIQLSQSYAQAYRGENENALRGFTILRDRIDQEKSSFVAAGASPPKALLDAETYVKHRLAGP